MAKKNLLVPIPLLEFLGNDAHDEDNENHPQRKNKIRKLDTEHRVNNEAAPHPKKKLIPQRLVFRPSELDDTPPATLIRNKKQPSQYVGKTGASKLNRNYQNSKVVFSKQYIDIDNARNRNEQTTKLKPKLLDKPSTVLHVKKSKSQSFNFKKQNWKVDLSKSNFNSNLKSRIKLKNEAFNESKESNKKRFSSNNVSINLNVEPSISTEPSPAENEFLELENRLRLDEDSKLNYEVRVNKILDEEIKEMNNFKALLNQMTTRQEKRHKEIRDILKKIPQRFSCDFQPLSEIASNVVSPCENQHENCPVVCHTDGKILKRFQNEDNCENNPKKKALLLYNQLRSVSKNVLSTPQMNRAGLLSPKSACRKNGSKSIAKIIQKQCLMLHDTPFGK